MAKQSMTQPSAASGAYWDGTSNATSLPLPRVIDVRDYGALFDNSTDDTAAIQAAISAAQRNLYAAGAQVDYVGSIVQMPPGRAKVTQIKVPSNVWLRGAGPSSTYLVGTNAALDLLVNNSATDVQITLSDFGVIPPSGGTQYGINLTSSGSANILGDERHVVRDIVVVGGYNGIGINGGTENRVTRCTVQRPSNDGIVVGATDSFVSDCTVGQPGHYGIWLAGANSRLWGCKVFGNATAYVTSFSGPPHFRISGAGRHQVVACESQDGKGAAFSSDGNNGSMILACTADSNYGFCFNAGAPNTRFIGCHAIARTGGAYVPTAAVQSPDGMGATPGCVFDISIEGTLPFAQSGATFVNGADFRLVSSAASVIATPAGASTYTPDALRAGKHFLTPAGNFTIANPVTANNTTTTIPVGTTLTFIITQDVTGGRTPTWGGAYTLTGGAVPTTASGKTAIAFTYDGAVWVESARSSLATSAITGLATAKGDIIAASAAGTFATVNVGTNAFVLTADSTQAAGVKWAAAAAAATYSGLYRSGGFYPLLELSAFTGTGANVQSREQAIPFIVSANTTFNAMAIEITVAAAASAVRLGIRNDSGSGSPGTVVADFGVSPGTLDSTTTGVKTATISQALTPGLYWATVTAQGGAPTFRIARQARAMVGWTTTIADTTQQPSGYWQDGVTGALGTFTIGGVNGSSGCPIVWLKAA